MMDYEAFLDVVKELNQRDYFYGNEVLYKMAPDAPISDKEKLAGAMWLIGRSYAASPERRNYGGKSKVKSSNDGRGGFF